MSWSLGNEGSEGVARWIRESNSNYETDYNKVFLPLFEGFVRCDSDVFSVFGVTFLLFVDVGNNYEKWSTDR